MNFPDKFVLLKIGNEGLVKVFASWSGGYTWGSSWKLNSGISKVTKKDQRYELEGYSGSVYSVNPDMYGTNVYTHSILQSFLKEEGIVLLNEEETLKYLLDNSQET